MAVTVIPTTTYAMEEFENDYEFSPDEVSIKYEIENKRTENSKTYLTEDGGYYQVSAAVPIHKEVNGEWEEISEIGNNIETVADAENAISEIATYSVSNPTNTGFYDSETLTMYTNGADTNPMKIAGFNKTVNGIDSCIYVRPSIITDKQVFINNATLSIATGTVQINGNEDSSNTINVYRLKNKLNQVQNVPLSTVDNVIIDRQMATTDTTDECKIDITSYAHYSSLGLYENTGLALEPLSENTYIEINSIVLGIYYREIGDVDKTIESETVDLDRAGTLYVNDYTCSPIIVRNDLSVYDELAQVNVQTIINPTAIDNNASDGVNTRTNYYSILQYENGEYYWKNCEGEYIYFVKNTNTNFVGANSSGDKYVLTCPNDKTDFGRITIKSEKDNTTYYFSKIGSDGYVTKIEYIFTDEDNNNKQYVNTVEITYDGENISYITDGSNRKYRFNYDNDMLNSISVHYNDNANGTEQPATANNKNIAVQYFYDESKKLTKVTYPDGYYVSYFYDENGRISNVTAYENNNSENAAIELTLNYQNGTVKASVLSKYTLKTNGIISKEVEINSPMDNTYNRVFSDVLNKSEKIMHYDQDSNLIHYKNYDGQEYYLNYSNKELQHLIYEDSSSTNIIKNGDFESNSNWNLTEGASLINNAPIKENGSSNNGVISFIADNKIANATQTVNVTPSKSYVLCCSAYCKQALPFKNNNDINKKNRYYSVRVYGAASGKLVGETYFDYNIVNNWQTSKCVIDIPETISKVKIEINSLNMPGECYFDDLKMYVATIDNASPVVPEPGLPKYDIVRNEYGQITDIIKVRTGDKTLGKHYEYDSSHYKSQVEEAGKVTYYNYDCGSGLLTSKGKNTDSSKNTQYTYSGIGVLTSVQQAITTAEGDTINQTVEYSYDDNDRISSIYHNGCLYEYTYNKNGKIENVIVKESAEENANVDYSMSYEYDLDNVGKVNFGNGASIIYKYDGSNIIKTIYDNGKSGDEKETYVYSYKYNSDGSVAEMTDEVSNTVTTYTSKGCTVKKNGTTVYSNTGSKINLFGTSFSYSQNTSQSKDKTTTTVKDSYTGSSVGPIVKAETVLDTFDRTMSTSVENKGNADKNTHYRLTSSTKYVEGINNRQTNLVSHYETELSKRSNKILPEKYENTRISAEWSYKYDNVGRVTSVFKKSTNNITLAPANKTSYAYNEGDLVRHYQYDEGGQISLEINPESHTAIRYYYNEGGNISKKVSYENLTSSDYSYNYSSDTLTFTPTKSGTTTSLEYKSNGMTDYLTSYSGHTITYDEAGNPLDYAGTGMDYSDIYGEMTWNGNLLTSFRDGNKIYKYTYDGDGKRTSKTYYEDIKDTVPTSIIEYIWDGDIITGYRAKFYGDPPEDESQTSSNSSEKVLYYDKTVKVIYNNNDIVGVCVIANEGEPATNNTSININETIEYMDWDQSANYTFVKDGQGNITEIYDPSEKVIISMSYDAYGNMKPNYIGTFVQDIKNKYNATGTWWVDLIQAFALAIVISMYLSGIFVSVEQGFKGYIYDIETGLYYGQKRYYSPAWGRFINASDPTTLTEDMSSVYNSNLFNYCGNDPVNNITKTGFNAPDQIISDAFVPQLVNSTNNLIKENRSTAKQFGEISTSLDVLSLGLRTTLDADAKTYWDETLNKQKDVVTSGYGLNYIESAIDKDTSSVTKYSVNEQNTPYKISKSVE